MDWKLLQLADSAFPTGGFAHSGGLEAAYQQGEVDGDSLFDWLEQALWQAGFAGLPFVGAGVDDFRSLKLADLRHHAFVSNPVANRASRAQGRSLMAACAAAFPDERLRVWADDDALLLHHAPALGAACAVLNVTRRDAQSLYLQTSLRGALSAAVRLGITGPLEAQRLQAASAPTLDAVLARCGALVLEEAAHTAPLHELFQGTQDRLYSRLFQS